MGSHEAVQPRVMLHVLHAFSSLSAALCTLGVVPLLLLGTGLRVLCSLTRAHQLKTQGTLGGLQLSLWGALLSAVLSSLLLPEFFTQGPQRRGMRASVWDPLTCTVAGHCVGVGSEQVSCRAHLTFPSLSKLLCPGVVLSSLNLLSAL